MAEKESTPIDASSDDIAEVISAYYSATALDEAPPKFKTTMQLLEMLRDHLAQPVEPVILRSALSGLKFQVEKVSDTLYWRMYERN